MAIRIPILTSFDPKGLKAANAQLGKLKSSVGSLGRNFAVLGAAIAGAGALIAKNVQSLARIERINAQTEQTIKSMGNTAGISAAGIEKLAGSLEGLTATEAETIQEGANLLLTFKNIQNQAGAGNDIFNQTAGVMVDLARAMGTSASGEAIRLGKALNDPIRGLTALTRVGVSFTDEQRDQVKALQESGDLMGAQKIILAELQSQFGGSGAAFAQTFSGQLELMGHELGTIGEEATLSVMPALQGMIEQLRELIPIIGPQLKAAIESVDFVALGQAVVGFTTFLVENAETIARVVAAIFIINTAFKTMQVLIGISNVAIALKTWFLAQLATGMTLTTIATTVMSTAMRLIPFVAVTAAVVILVAELFKAGENFRTLKDAIEKANPAMDAFTVATAAAGGTLLDFDTKGLSPVIKLFQDAVVGILKFIAALKGIPTKVTTTVTTNFVQNGRPDELFGDNRPNIAPPLSTPTVGVGSGSGGGGGSISAGLTGLPALIADAKKQGNIAKKETKLIGNGLSAAVAGWITSSSTPIKAAAQAQARIAKNGQKAIANLTRSYNKSSAGQAAAASAAAEASQAAASAAQAFAEAQAQAAAAEAAIVAERERVYQAFADSVKNTFAGIKNSILGAFDLTQLGGSTNAITRNMDKLLIKLKSFATNVSKLSSMGLNSALLQQVISAGPMAGARLAESLVMGGTSSLAAINAGFSEFGVLSGQIAQTGTESLFNNQAQQSIYNINVDGGVGSGATIGKAIVEAIRAYERTSGAVFQGA
jgi:hypothetical protein